MRGESLKKIRLPLLIVLALVMVATGCTPTGTKEGDKAPDFQLQDLEGNTVSLSEFRGSQVMLNFWATWCPPCRMEMPLIQEIYQERTGTGLVILAVNVGEGHTLVSSFMQYYSYTMPVLLDTSRIVTQRYNVGAYPTTFFIDDNGIIQDKVIGAFPSKENLEQYIENIISP